MVGISLVSEWHLRAIKKWETTLCKAWRASNRQAVLHDDDAAFLILQDAIRTALGENDARVINILQSPDATLVITSYIKAALPFAVKADDGDTIALKKLRALAAQTAHELVTVRKL